MAEFEDLDCACAGLEGEGNPNIDQESIDVLVGVIRELHHKKKILDYKECKTIRHSGASQYKCYFELAFALLAKPHEKVKTAIKVLEKSNDPVIVQYRQIPQFLNVCLELHQLLNHEDVQEMKRRQLELIERIIHVVCMKDFAAVNELADVLGMYGFSEEKDWLLVYVKWYEERVLTFKDVQDLKEMRTPFLQRIWKLFSSKDPDALRKAGDIVRRTVHDDLTSLFPVLADIQELRYLSDEEYSSLFDHPATSLSNLLTMAFVKDRDTCKGIAAVLQKHGYDDESKKVIVYVKLHEERVLTDEDVQDSKKMIAPFLQRIWRLLRSKDPDALRKAGDIFWRYANSRIVFPTLADIQESQYLSNEEYSSLFDDPSTSLPGLVKIAIAKDKDTSKGIAAVLKKHGYNDPSKTVIVLAEFVAEECLSVEEGTNMIDLRNQLGREWIAIWSHAAADKTSQVSEQMAKILDAHGFTEEAVAVRRRETVGDPMPPPQPGHGTVGDPRLPPQPVWKSSSPEPTSGPSMLDTSAFEAMSFQPKIDTPKRDKSGSGAMRLEPKSDPSHSDTSKSDEKELEERCWIPFGIQTLTVGNEGGTFLLQPEDKHIEKDHLIRLDIPANAVNTSVCKGLSIRYAILVHGPFALPESYELASPVVYINFNPDHLSQSSKLELHLPHWARKRRDVFTAVAPHKVDKNGQYNFDLSTIEENPHASSVIIPISGHTSLFAEALQDDCQKSYLLLPFYNQLRTELRMFVTYFCAVWPEILKKKEELRELILDQHTPFESSNLKSCVKAKFSSQVHLVGPVKIKLEELQMKGRYNTGEELEDGVKHNFYPPSLVFRALYKEGMQQTSTQVEIQRTRRFNRVTTIANYPLTVWGTSPTVTVDPLPRPSQPDPDPEQALLGPKDVFEKYGWRDLTKDVKAMLKDERVVLLEKQYKLIDAGCRHEVAGLLRNGDYGNAANSLLAYFEKNHKGRDLLKFCQFLRDEVKEAGGGATLTAFANKLEKLVKPGKP